MTEMQLIRKIHKMIDESGLPNTEELSQRATKLEKKQTKLLDEIYQELYDFLEKND